MQMRDGEVKDIYRSREERLRRHGHQRHDRFWWRGKSHKHSGMNRARRYHEKKNAGIEDQLDDIGASPGSIELMILFAAAQDRTMQE